MKDLKDILKKADNDLSNTNKSNIIPDVFKIYTFKILQKLKDNIINCQKKVIFPYYGKYFIDKLSDNLHHDSKFNYQDNLKSDSKTRPKHLAFEANTKSNRKKKIEDAKVQTDKSHYLLPYQVNFLEHLVLNRKR